MERLSAPFSFQDAAGEEGTFTGLASVFGREFPTEYGPTIIEPGAFAASLQARPQVPVLWQHDAGEPIGLITQMQETAEGLGVVGRLSETLRGKDARTLLRDRVIRDLSIGFDKREAQQSLPRRLKVLDLFEVSLVTWGAAGPVGAQVREVNRAVAPFLRGSRLAAHRIAGARLRAAARTAGREQLQVASDEDRRQMIQLALADRFGGEGIMVWVEAMFPQEVVFEIQADGEAAGLFRIGFAITDGGVTFSGDPVRVRRITTFEPLT